MKAKRLLAAFSSVLIFSACQQGVRHDKSKTSEMDMPWPCVSSALEGAVMSDGRAILSVVKNNSCHTGWGWSENKKAEAFRDADEHHRHELFNALRTRPLTDAEMKEVVNYGDLLNLDEGVPYYEDQKNAELTHALQIQLILQEKAREKQH